MDKCVTYLHCKAAEQNGERWLTAWATTPRQDLVGDVVRPEGAQYRLPLPLLAFHKHDEPIGSVIEAHVTPAGIRVKARLTEGVQRAEEMWKLLCDRAINSVSIGFSVLKSTPLAGGGMQVDSWLWHELSCVTVPANPDAKISIGKSLAYASPEKAVQTPAKTVSPEVAHIDPERFGRAVGDVIQKALAKQERRIAELETVASAQQKKLGHLVERALLYAGTHQAALGYQRGSLVKHGGALHLAIRDVKPGGAPPGRHGSGWEHL